MSKLIAYKMKTTLDILKSDITKGFISTSFFGIITKAITVLVTLYCSNMLSSNDFGEFGYLKNTLEIIVMICAANFSGLAIKFAAESMESKTSLKRLYILVAFTLTISLISGIVLQIIPSSLLNIYFISSSITFYIKLIGLFLPIFIIYPIISAILRGYKEFTLSGIYETAVSISYFVFVIIGVLWFGGKGAINALLLFHILASLIGLFILYIYNRKKQYLLIVTNIKEEYRCLYIMILPVFLMSFIEAPLQWIGQTEVARRGSYTLVGCLTVIVQIRYIIQMLPSFFYSSFTSFVSIMNSQHKYKEYFDKFAKIAKLLGLLSVILLIVLIFLGKYILALFNDIYVENYSSYLISLLSVPLLLYGALYKLNMMVREHQRSMLFMSIISSLSFILFLYIFISFGINVLSSFFLSQIVQFGLQCLIGWKIFIKDKRTSLLY